MSEFLTQSPRDQESHVTFSEYANGRFVFLRAERLFGGCQSIIADPARILGFASVGILNVHALPGAGVLAVCEASSRVATCNGLHNQLILFGIQDQSVRVGGWAPLPWHNHCMRR